MKFRKHLQNIFKSIAQKIFFLLYGKIKIDKLLNVVGFQKFNLGRKKNIYQISNGRVYTDLVEHVAVIKNNTIIPNISYQQVGGELKPLNFNKTLISGTPRIIKKFNGKTVTLVQGASGNNYFHFLFDIIPKLILCEKYISLQDVNFFYLPGELNWQKKILSAFGIPEKKIINSQKYRHIKSDIILGLDHPWYTKGFVHDEFENSPEWIIESLRVKFLKYSKKFDCSEKIFLDRSDSKFNHCKIINNSEIITYLSKKGFKTYQLSKLDFFEQIYLFNNAKIIIGAHGAGFSNIVFSNPGTKILEIIPKTHPRIIYKKISNTLNLSYSKIISEPVSKHERNLGDLKIQTEELERYHKDLI
jgi:capsular polysaccharide biosynthesis protein|tara:strand:+ start:573 stop:1649 length:1077 start_codon:yes stop_codon:yes gene_type:complete